MSFASKVGMVALVAGVGTTTSIAQEANPHEKLKILKIGETCSLFMETLGNDVYDIITCAGDELPQGDFSKTGEYKAYRSGSTVESIAAETNLQPGQEIDIGENMGLSGNKVVLLRENDGKYYIEENGYYGARLSGNYDCVESNPQDMLRGVLCDTSKNIAPKDIGFTSDQCAIIKDQYDLFLDNGLEFRQSIEKMLCMTERRST